MCPICQGGHHELIKVVQVPAHAEAVVDKVPEGRIQTCQFGFYLHSKSNGKNPKSPNMSMEESREVLEEEKESEKGQKLF